MKSEMQISGIGFTDAEEIKGDFFRAATAVLRPSGRRMTIVIDSLRVFEHCPQQRKALGGLRAVKFADASQQLAETAELARGMTKKNAFVSTLDRRGQLRMGGAKSSIDVDLTCLGWLERQHLFQAAGMFIAAFNNESEGWYYTAHDMNITDQDVGFIQHGLGMATVKCPEHPEFFKQFAVLTPEGYGNPSSYTALSASAAAFGALKAIELSTGVVRGDRILIYGCGATGSLLAERFNIFHREIYLADPNPDRRIAVELIDRTLSLCGGQKAHVYPLYELGGPEGWEEVKGKDINFFIPCARHYDCNQESLKALLPQVQLVCGTENNLFAADKDVKAWHEAGVTVIQDWVANCGGATLAIAESNGVDKELVRGLIERLKLEVCGQVCQSLVEGVSHSQIVEAKIAAKFRL